MNFIKSFLCALSLSTLSIPGAMARVDAGTENLLDTVESHGIDVVFNTDRCNHVNILGVYRWSGMKRQIVLCPGETVDAQDHATVRHEVMHAVQHCVNTERGTSRHTPVLPYTDLKEAVNLTLSVDQVELIKTHYPQSEWLIEFEATLAEEMLTADEMAQAFLNHCTI